ncbi:hypothetical protein [Pseudomonas anguilliseptica]|uniref:XRE family transcriptional regulator n=1 Tax=Pseudomonas anguilliseptica TaxID=53406 RepID=A0A1H5F582_PSEAG|nr:hypothetical protein [Pseudomonas anguilliseptica]SED98298.1 hypothetical protein SAMN05421553_3779 [Pseudomonas anguilliseptica]
MSEEKLPEKVEKLLSSGLTYKVIAGRANCDTSTIFRIKNGDIANPSYAVGTAIDQMFSEIAVAV